MVKYMDEILQKGKLEPRRACQGSQSQNLTYFQLRLLPKRWLLKAGFSPNSTSPTFMALKSFFIFSGIPVMKESSGNSRISPFSSLNKRKQSGGQRWNLGLTRGGCKSALTNLSLRNFHKTPGRGQENRKHCHVLYPSCHLSQYRQLPC